MVATALALPISALRVLVDIVLPPRCPSCRAIVSSDNVYCADCWGALRFITAPMCACCGLPFEFEIGPEARCGACIETLPRFASARAAMIYDGTARNVLLGFKNRDREHLARVMAPAMVRAGAFFLTGGVLLVPVPLHRWRLWQRGYNQAALLAQAIARTHRLDISVDALVRVRATPRSRGMSRKRRAANVRAVFRVGRADVVRGRDIVLVDDVMTTGATAAACTRLLLRNGALSVHIITWARVVRSGDHVA